MSHLKYIITETGPSDSYDPLNADKTQNLPVMRMMYLTPLEVDSNNRLTSKILYKFSYDVRTNKVTFSVKDNLFFGDGSLISPHDVLIAIKRMAYFRPDFPIIRDIEGVKEWSEQRLGLEGSPSGIIIQDNNIILQLVKKKTNPLFRFCLELFSIIPSKCIDMRTGALICPKPPESGYYLLASQLSDTMVFTKRLEMRDAHGITAYDRIEFDYKTLSTACEEDLNSDTIIAGNEVDLLSSKQCQTRLTSTDIHWLPASRFGVLRFNTDIEPFNDQRCRRLFAGTVRGELRKTQLDVQASLFTKIIPGFLKESDLVDSTNEDCVKFFKNKTINLFRTNATGVSVVSDAIISAAKKLGMIVREVDSSTTNLVDDFISGKTPVISGASGFWAQDPIGDMVMWFTPNLHKSMSFIWKDKNLYKLINQLDQEHDEAMQRQEAETLNRYIARQSIIAPVVHFRRFYLTSKSQTKSVLLPQAITSPAPWQLLPRD